MGNNYRQEDTKAERVDRENFEINTTDIKETELLLSVTWSLHKIPSTRDNPLNHKDLQAQRDLYIYQWELTRKHDVRDCHNVMYFKKSAVEPEVS